MDILGGKRDDIVSSHIMPRLDLVSLARFTACDRGFRRLGTSAEAQQWWRWTERLASLEAGFPHCPKDSGSSPGEWDDPRCSSADWSRLRDDAAAQFKVLVSFKLRLVRQNASYFRSSAAGCVQQFESMLEANECIDHPKHALTEAAIFEAMMHSVTSLPEHIEWDEPLVWSSDEGVYEGDTQCALCGDDFGWGDTCVRDAVFDALLDILGYGRKHPQDPTIGFAAHWNYYGPDVPRLYNRFVQEPWKQPGTDDPRPQSLYDGGHTERNIQRKRSHWEWRHSTGWAALQKGQRKMPDYFPARTASDDA